MSAPEDEFDTIPDAFEGIDFNAIPELQGNTASQSHAQVVNQDQEEDKFDDLPDPFAGLDWNTVPELGEQNGFAPVPAPAPTTTHDSANNAEEVQISSPPHRPSGINPSTQYSFDELDEALLVEIDASEANIEEPPPLPQTSARESASSSGISGSFVLLPFPIAATSNLAATGAASHGINAQSPAASVMSYSATAPRTSVCRKRPSQEVDDIPVSSRKRERQSDSYSESQSPKKKGKKGKGKEKAREEVDPHAGVRRLLSDFEEELNCPICCDLLIAAHIGNPCGHTYCGPCGHSWISKNKRAPTCAICRTRLVSSTPMIPNRAVDNMVERHIGALAASGSVDWQPSGTRSVEWSQRKEKWKKEAAERAASARKPAPARAPALPAVPVFPQVPMTQDIIDILDFYDELDEDYEDSDSENSDDD